MWWCTLNLKVRCLFWNQWIYIFLLKVKYKLVIYCETPNPDLRKSDQKSSRTQPEKLSEFCKNMPCLQYHVILIFGFSVQLAVSRMSWVGSFTVLWIYLLMLHCFVFELNFKIVSISKYQYADMIRWSVGQLCIVNEENKFGFDEKNFLGQEMSGKFGTVFSKNEKVRCFATWIGVWLLNSTSAYV